MSQLAMQLNPEPELSPYFGLLEPKARKHLRFYRDDFFVHDKQQLDEFDGSIIWCVRNSGTHLVMFEDEPYCVYPGSERDREIMHPSGTSVFNHKRKEYCEYQLELIKDVAIERNEHFYIGERGKVRKVSADAAMAFALANVNFKTSVGF